MIQIFKALSEDSRLRIVSLFLSGDDLCVCEVEEILNMTQSNVSRHLNVLKNSGILVSYRKAQWTYYQLNRTFISENKELWEYLKRRFFASESFYRDSKKLEECRSSDLCGCKAKKENRHK